MADARDDFYVGYLPEAPRALARVTKTRVIGLALAVVALVPVLVVAQKPFSKAAFEFGSVRDFTGVVRLDPFPTLLVPRVAGGPSSYLLVASGKRGVGGLEDLVGRRVSLRGTLIYRDDQTMIEIEDGSVSPNGGIWTVQVDGRKVAADSFETRNEDLGEHTYVGEIVDSKCFLGVMKPGNTKPHRACATLCIRGGIPPVLLVRDDTGRASYFLLASEEGEAVNQDVLDLVAEPVEITGRVLRYGDQLVLRADPDTYNRLE